MRRRDLLRGAAIGVAAAPNVAPLLDALFSPPHSDGPALPFPQFTRAVAAAKIDYKACRYERVLDRLVTLLPALEPVKSGAAGEQRQRAEVLTADLYHVVGSVLLKVGDRGTALVAAERSTRAAAASQDPVAIAASARAMTHALMGNGHDAQAVTLAGNAADSLDRYTRLASTDAVAVYGALVLRGAIAAARRARAYIQWGRYEHGLSALRTAYEVAPEEIRCRPAVQRIAGDLALLATGSVRTAAVGFAQSAGVRL